MKGRSRSWRSQASPPAAPARKDAGRTVLLAGGLLFLLGGCRTEEPSAMGMFLLQKGPYQAFYGPGGRLERILQDRNGDGRAEVVTLFDAEGRTSVSEIDTDGDGVVDRWERYSPEGSLVRIETSRHRRGAPDVWEELNEEGQLVRRELDDDGDGKPDRTELVAPPELRRVEVKADSAGRRWEVYDGARLAAEELDTDGDGEPDRRLVRGALGELVRVEKRLDGRWVEVPLRPR